MTATTAAVSNWGWVEVGGLLTALGVLVSVVVWVAKAQDRKIAGQDAAISEIKAAMEKKQDASNCSGQKEKIQELRVGLEKKQDADQCGIHRRTIEKRLSDGDKKLGQFGDDINRIFRCLSKIDTKLAYTVDGYTKGLPHTEQDEFDRG